MSVISFVILHYGNIEVTKSCVDSILQLDTKDDVHIVVVDNDTHKTVKERQKLKDEFMTKSEVEVIQIQEKSGFSRANNIGYAYTKKMHDPDYVVMANNDIVFYKRNFINDIKLSYDGCDYAVLNPDIISKETGNHQSPIDIRGRTKFQVYYTIILNYICLHFFEQVYPLIRGSFQNIQRENKLSNMFREDVVPCGACIVFSRDFILNEEQALFPETDFYYEEYILHYRCKKSGYKIVYDPRVIVLHGDGIATKKSTGEEKKKARFIMENTLRSAKIYKCYMDSKI